MQEVTSSPCKHSGFRFEEFRSALTPAALADLEAAFEPIVFDKESTIFNAVEIADKVLLIKTGCVTIANGHKTNDQRLTSQADGHIFGLMEVLAGSPHRIALKAATDVQGWALPADKAIKLLRDHPQLSLRVLALVAAVYNESIPHLT